MMIIKRTVYTTAIATLFFLMACNTADTSVKYNAGNKAHDSIAVYTFNVNKGFGYSIFIHDKEFIHQDCIPVVQGIKPFVTEEDAETTGKFVAQKIRNGQMPTLTLNELGKLGITLQ